MIINTKVKNWEKHQAGRKGQGKYYWFKLQNDFWDDPKIYNLTPSAKLLYVFLLSECSRLNKGEIQINFKLASNKTGLSKPRLKSSINSLTNQGFMYDSCSVHAALNKNRTEESIYIEPATPIKPKLLDTPKKSLSTRNDVKDLVDTWNINCGHFSLEDYTKLPVTAIQKIHGLLDNDGLDFWKDLIKKAAQYSGGEIDLLFLINSPELRYKIQKVPKPVNILEGCDNVKNV